MKRLSSNLTLVFKIFIPLVYMVFFGSFLIGSLLVSVNDAPLIGSNIFRLAFAGIFILFLGLMYLSVGRLKRVDGDETGLYISNYIKTYKYSWDDIKEVKVQHYGLFRTMKVHFKAKSSFGNKITFLAAPELIKEFILNHPSIVYLFKDDL